MTVPPTPPGLETPMIDSRPHSRACGIRLHGHGPSCAPDCRTCGGQPVLAPAAWAAQLDLQILDWDGWTNPTRHTPQVPGLPVTRAEFEARAADCTVAGVPAQPTQPATAVCGFRGSIDGEPCHRPAGHDATSPIVPHRCRSPYGDGNWIDYDADGNQLACSPGLMRPSAAAEPVHYALRGDHVTGSRASGLANVTCDDCLTWASETLQTHLEERRGDTRPTPPEQGRPEGERPLRRTDLAGFLPRDVVDTGRLILAIDRGTSAATTYAENDPAAGTWAAARADRYLLGPIEVPDNVQIRYGLPVPATVALHTAVTEETP